MEKLPNISESEWEVMKVIWSEHPITSGEVVKSLEDSTLWKPRTIKTLLNRLVDKGAVGREGKGKDYRYFPLIEKAVLVKAESQSFLKRVFGGSLKPMIATMVETEDLSPEDIEEIKQMFEDL